MILHSEEGIRLVREPVASTLDRCDTLLTTKLSIPLSLSTCVPRPRLIEKLDAGLHRRHRLTLVSAPAGSGKTTLLSAWLSTKDEGGRKNDEGREQSAHPSPFMPHPFKVAWLALDPEDNQPVRFWAYLIAAVQTIAPELGQQAQRLLAALHRPHIRTIAASLLNDLAAYSETVILVLDNYQSITATAIHKSLAFVADHAPPQLHMVLSSRADPPLPLVRLRARDQLTELRTADLRLTPEETAAFLTTMTDMHWSPDEARSLYSSTEGWIVGLQIAGLELQRLLALSSTIDIRRAILGFIDTFSGRHHDIRDFLEEEVLKRQPERIQSFLTVTSILERLNASLCDALTGQTGSQAVLEQLDKANLFLVPLDAERYWYRYHVMFADVLQWRLYQAQADLASILHRRAAAWYQAHGYVGQAIAHRLRAEQIDLATQSGDQNWVHLPHMGMIAQQSAGSNVAELRIPSDQANAEGQVFATPQPLDEATVLVPAIRMAQQYELEAPQTLSAPLPRHASVQLLEQLTERELAILQLIAAGLTYIEISRQLVVSLNTVRFHVKNMYGKLNVHHRTLAIARAKELGLLSS